MAGLLPSEVVGLGGTKPQEGLAELFVHYSDILKVLPVVPGNSATGYVYNEETELPKGGPIPLNTGIIPQGKFRTTQRVVPFSYFGGSVPIDERYAPLTASVQDLFGLTADAQVKQMSIDLEKAVIQADSAVDSATFNGLRALGDTSDAAVSHDFGGNPVSKRGTDKMWNKLHPLARKNALWLAMGDSEVDVREFLGTYASAAEKMSEAFGRPMIHLHDRPVLVTESITADEDATGTAGGGSKCSLYLVGFDPSGRQGLFGVVPPKADLAVQVGLFGPDSNSIHRMSRVMVSLAMALPSKYWMVRGFNIANAA